jgi:Alr-MurF fusion protein
MIQSNAAYLLTDSRQLLFPSQTLFFAIQGEHHDGHRFVGTLYERGVRQFVVEKKALNESFRQELKRWPDAQIWEVESSLQALQEMAKHHRSQYHIPVVGITGSNGKTIVKEWLSQLLGTRYRVVKSPKSYNSQIGVPLSVWGMNSSHTLGIFEAGVSQPFEMKKLQEIIQPTIGIFTNIGSAHDAGFRSRKQKVAEKLQLFTKSEQLIYRSDYPDIDQEIQLLLKSVNPRCTLISWAKTHQATIQVTLETQAKQTHVGFKSSNESFDNQSFNIPFTDDASVENAIHCVVLMRLLGIEVAEINQLMQRLSPVSMRLEMKAGINDCLLIDDTYNNDVVGLTMAFHFLSQQEQRLNKVAILSDLLQTGQKEADLYTEIATLLVEKGVDQLIAIGEAFGRNRHLIPINAQFYPTTDQFLREFPMASLRHSLILIKGARPFQFERIVNRLQQKVHDTVFEINLDALTHNLNFYRNRVGSDVKIMVMVKAFAYGSGSNEVAQLLQFHHVDYLAVAYADEGVYLRQNGIELPIMVMNPTRDSFEVLVEYRLEPEIYSPALLDAWLKFNQVAVGIHLKLDTGMHRLGFSEADLPYLSSTLKQHHKSLLVKSIFSHLAGADESHHNAFSHAQYERFTLWSHQIEEVLGYRPLRHILNSAGIVRYPDFKMDMVRLGIGLYGVEVNQQAQHELQQVGTLKTVISQIKHLEAGETVGYSRSGKVERATTLATIAIGYADGYDRRFSKGVGSVLVNGVRCPVVGNVCMDMTMIDITDATAQEGDEVIVFGQTLPVQTLAQQIGTIAYELLTGVSERVKRVFVKE